MTQSPASRKRSHEWNNLQLFPLHRNHSLRRPLGLFILFLLSNCAIVSAWGQFDSASVLGAIKDPSGAAIPSATVVLTNPSKGISVTRQTGGRDSL